MRARANTRGHAVIQALEHRHTARVQRVATQFVARESGAINEVHTHARYGKLAGSNRAGGTGADDENITVELHVQTADTGHGGTETRRS